MPIQQPTPITLCKPAWVVVCRHSRDFHLGQAASLKRQFERLAGSDWDFICLTDQPSEDWHLPLRTDWPGWWGILESFRLTGQPHVLTGLDTLLYGDLRPILRLAETCPPSVLYGIRDLGKPGQWASGVTVWHGDWSFLAERFDPTEHRRRFQTPSHPVPAPRPGSTRPAPVKSNFLAANSTRPRHAQAQLDPPPSKAIS
jgi:hypothetical protein